jgi:hypothetical protein
MLIDDRKLHHNNLQHLSNVLQAHMDKLEGKTTNCDQSGDLQQPQFGMCRDHKHPGMSKSQF